MSYKEITILLAILIVLGIVGEMDYNDACNADIRCREQRHE